mmetsp:Transcript_6467/g.7126  ORF Transcript_6467/g.7126 Transcript_6467/m.7126 type:complete len:230 (+) Transcript_6467:3-692(+)
MQSAIEMDLAGASQLRAGNYEEASRSFAMAVTALRKALLNRKRSDEVLGIPAFLPMTYFGRLPTLNNPSGCFVFKFAAFVDDTSRLKPKSNNLQDHWRAACMMYNCALANHLKAIEQGKSQYLLKSLDYYIASRSLLSESIFENAKNDISFLRLSLAILNNTGHIYGELGKNDYARQCFDQIIFTMVQTTHPLIRINSTISCCQVDPSAAEIYLNALVLRSSPVSAKCA